MDFLFYVMLCMQMLGSWTFYLEINKDLPFGSKIFDLSIDKMQRNDVEYFITTDESNHISKILFAVDKVNGTLLYTPNKQLNGCVFKQKFFFKIHVNHSSNHFYCVLPFEIHFVSSRNQVQRKTSTMFWYKHSVNVFSKLSMHSLNRLMYKSCPNYFMPKSICSCTVSNSTNSLSNHHLIVKQFISNCNIFNVLFPMQELDIEITVLKRPKKLVRHRRNNFHLLYFKFRNNSLHILENSPSNTLVGRIQAYENDKVAEEVTYGLEPMENIHSLEKFRIDETGTIYSKVALDRELFAHHQFRVTASRFNANQARTILIIKVDDKNDNQPVFVLPDGYQQQIAENLPLQSLVFRVNAYDADEGENGQVEYSILRFTPFAGSKVFQVLFNGDLVVKGKVDREEHAQYNLTIKAKDKGKPSLFSILHVTIDIEDQNDNSPQFSQSKYVVNVNENKGVGTLIGKVSAHDRDAGNNGKVTYSLIQGNRDKFRLNPNTGEVFIRELLDYEEAYISSHAKYTLVVRASDGGQPPHSNSSGIMEIHVLDVNDNSPQFHNVPYNFQVQENAQINFVVGQVEAFDQDHGANAQITYSIMSQALQTGHHMFKIDRNSGVVRVAKRLDYETKNQYNFTVVASDNGISQRFVQTKVYITVLDVNDNAPQFNHDQYEVRIAEDTNVGDDIIVVNATDPDKESHGKINYLIIEGNVGKKFSIVTRNDVGIIKLIKHLDYSEEQLYSLKIKASDGLLSVITTVSIFITDTNSHQPVFDQAEYSLSLAEDVGIGTVVIKVHASDADVGENARITYCFTDNTR